MHFPKLSEKSFVFIYERKIPKEGVIMANKHSCEKYDRMIDDYIDGILSDADREKLEAHLSTCEECRRSLRFAAALREMIRGSAENQPADMHQNIMESVKKDQKTASRKKLIRLGAIAAAFAVICLSSAVAFAMLPGNQKTNDLPEDDAIAEGTFIEDSPSINESSEKNEIVGCGPDEPEAPPATDFIPEEPAEDTFAAAEEVESNENAEMPDIAVPECTAPNAATEALTEAEMLTPETDTLPEVSHTSALEHATDAVNQDEGLHPTPESSSNRPGGEEITLALLIVSGLLAVASFIAFLISLSSVRKGTSNKDQ